MQSGIPESPAIYRGIHAQRVAYGICAPCTVRECMLALGFSRSTLAKLFAVRALLVQHRTEPACDMPTMGNDAVSEPAMDDAPVSASAHTQLVPGDELLLQLGRLQDDGAKTPDACCGDHAVAKGLDAQVRLLYRDPFLLAADKPQGLLVHGDGTGAPTLTDAVACMVDDDGFPSSPQAIQRLDVETSGIVLFSRLKEYQSQFDALVAGTALSKVYLAICEGTLPNHEVCITDPIARDRHDASRMRTTRQGGMEALTRIEPLAFSDGLTLVRVVLGTGRRHQIRVHCAAHDWPVLGDPLYGNGHGVRSLMLHAYAESFMHPVTGEHLVLTAGWPDRFSRWFDASDVNLSCEKEPLDLPDFNPNKFGRPVIR